MATPVVTPYVLMQELQKAKAKGGPSDFYGLGAAMRGVGNDFDAMQKTMSNTLSLQDQEAQLNARLGTGFYPAQAERQVSGFNLGKFQDESTMRTHKSIQDAFQRSISAGYKPELQSSI